METETQAARSTFLARPLVEAAEAGREEAQTLLDWSTRLATALAWGGDPSAALRALCEAIRTLLPCDRVQIWRGDVRQMTMQTMIAVGYPEPHAAVLREKVVPMGDMRLINSDFLTEKVALIECIDALSESESEIFAPFGIGSAVFLLLERGPRVLGALQLSWCSDQARLPNPAIVEIIRLHAGLAVDFVARTDEAHQLSESLSDTATLLARIHDPDELLPAMARKVAEAVGCEWASVHLLAEHSYEMRRVAVHGFADPPAERNAPPVTLDWMQEQIAASPDGVLEIPDVTAVPQLDPQVRETVSSYITVPLVEDGRLVGVVTTGYWKRTGRFARRQIALAKGLAQHALVALRNARLVRSLQEANQVKDDFVAAVSHDLRTPLHVLIGYNAMLLEGAAGALNEEQHELVTRMYDCSVRFLDLINGVLGLGRVEGGFDNVVLAPVSLAELRARILREVDYLRQPGVELRFDAPDVVVSADGAKVETILRNLVTNALKFTTRGFVAVELCPGEAELVMRVCDTGPGIHPDEQPKVFEMFRQGTAGLRSGGSGLGLGLYLVRRLSEMLGGTVALGTGPCAETVFEVRVPLAAPPRAAGD